MDDSRPSDRSTEGERPGITEGPGDPGPAHKGRRRLILAGVVLLAAAVVSGMALYRDGDERPAADLTVGWGGSEGHPSCIYHPKDHTVVAKITIEGEAPRRDTVTVTVSAHADENTSKPVGSSSRSVQVEGTVHRLLLVTIPVEKAPHVDVDGETACVLVVT